MEDEKYKSILIKILRDVTIGDNEHLTLSNNRLLLYINTVYNVSMTEEQLLNIFKESEIVAHNNLKVE